MTIRSMDHVGVIVDDLDGAIEFFVQLGLEVQGRMEMDGEPVADRLLGLSDVRTEFAMLQTADGRRCLELIRFLSPANEPGSSDAPANARGIRHVALVVDDIDEAVAGLRSRGGELVGELVRYGDIYKLCYVRGPDGIIVELAEPLG